MGEEALKACPWCKALPTPYETRDGETFFRHPRNQCILNDFRIAPEDVAAWNTRPSTPSEDDVVEAARWMSAIPMIRTDRGTWSKVHYEQDGTIGRDVTADEADAVGAWQFHMLKPDSAIARAALAARSQGGV
jgi:hypothetical protein